jgi:transcription antitermination factor NusG
MQLADYSWYAVMTNAQAEEEAARDIRRLGYKALYLHTCDWVEGPTPQKSRLLKRPLLSRYIFAGLSSEHYSGGVPILHEVSRARGVSTVVRAPGGEPFPIPLRAMEYLTENIELPSGMIWLRKPRPKFAGKVGDTIRLSEANAYQGLMAEIMSVDPRGLITIEIESFGRKVPAQIDLDDVGTLYDPSGVPVDKCAPTPEPVNSGR